MGRLQVLQVSGNVDLKGNHGIGKIRSGKPIRESRKPTTKEVLLEKSAPGAFHDSQERSNAQKCHPNTRVAATNDIVEQVKIALVSTIIWLYGAAGAGKSSIAQTVAEMCSRDQLLIGCFFFFRTDPHRNNVERLAASLVYHLAQTIPSTLQYITACVQKNPAIFESSLEIQLRQLFVEPLRKACEDDPELRPSHRLLILDGLDECDTPGVQQDILKVLGKVFRITPIPIVVLVASRPELHISSIFDSPEDLSQLTTFPIGLSDKYDADADIRLYTRVSLENIKCSHPLKESIPEDWPTSKDVRMIVQKSSGQFIFAATIVRDVGSTSQKPHERLQIALDALNRFSSEVDKSPFAALDALYMQILSGVEERVVVLAILHHVLNIDPTGSNFCADDIARCFNLAPEDLKMYLGKLASLIKFERQDKPIRVYHASLRDFLLDESRSQSFYIRQEEVLLFLSKIYLNHILSGDSNLLLDIPVATKFLGSSLPRDEELFTILSRLEADFSTPLYKYLVTWKLKQCYRTARGFWEFISQVEKLSDIIKFHVQNTTFWDRCLFTIHSFLKVDLQHYGLYNPTLELLTYTAFVNTAPSQASPSLSRLLPFANMCWGLGDVPDCLSIPLDSLEDRHPILLKFLLDKSLSGELAITPSHFVRTALRCAKHIETSVQTGAFQRSLKSLSAPNETSYAIYGLNSLLKIAPRDGQLVRSLESYHRQLRAAPSSPPIHVLLQTVKSYLENQFASGSHPEGHSTSKSSTEISLSSESYSIKYHPASASEPSLEVGSVFKHFLFLILIALVGVLIVRYTGS